MMKEERQDGKDKRKKMNTRKLIKNPIMWLITIAIILNIIDVITAYKILPGEANPIYLLTGSYLVIVGAKIFVIGVLLWGYKSCFRTQSKRPSDSALFIYTIYLLLFICALSFGIYTNTSAEDVQISNIAEQKAEMTDQQLNDYNQDTIRLYFRIIFTLMIYPAIIGIIAFYIWKKGFLMNGGILGERHK